MPVVFLNPVAPNDRATKPLAGIATVNSGTVVPTTGAVVVLESLKNAVAAPTFDRVIEWIVPAEDFTRVALVVAAEDNKCVLGKTGVTVTLPAVIFDMVPTVVTEGIGESTLTSVFELHALITTAGVPEVYALQ